MAHRKCAPLAKIPLALEKTGFVLERKVSEVFKKAGWSVISSRYYVDDVDGRARELDLVCYRVQKVGDLDVYSVALVSCKKDERDTWAFMSKDRPASDPNVDWEPIHFWTDRQPLSTFLQHCEWRKAHMTSNKRVFEGLFRDVRDVFAAQLIKPSGEEPNNDTPIFNSVSGLFKALDHELTALPERAKGKSRLYLFSLVTIADVAMVDVQYKGDQVAAKEVSEMTYLARYMVRKRELAAHVHFVRSDVVEAFVLKLSALADHNCQQSTALVKASYEAIRFSVEVQAHFAARLEPWLSLRLGQILTGHGRKEKVAMVELEWSSSGNELVVGVDLYGEALATLLRDAEAVEVVRRALIDYAKYSGKFRIDSAIPF